MDEVKNFLSMKCNEEETYAEFIYNTEEELNLVHLNLNTLSLADIDNYLELLDYYLSK